MAYKPIYVTYNKIPNKTQIMENIQLARYIGFGIPKKDEQLQNIGHRHSARLTALVGDGKEALVLVERRKTLVRHHEEL